MKNKKIKIIFLIFFLFLKTTNILAKNYRAYILGDRYGKIYYQENSEKKYPIASLTKIMTVMITLDKVYENKIRFNDVVVIDREVARIRGSSVPLRVGEKIKVIDLLKATAMRSANNAAYALAKYVGEGDVSLFIDLMNIKAKRLGLENELEFYTPTGLPDHMTKKKMDVGTAKGIYKLALAARNYSDYMLIVNRKEDFIKNGKLKIKSTFRKVLGKEGIFGLKTGYHSKARWNLVTLAKKNGQEVVCVILGGVTPSLRNQKALELNKKFHAEHSHVKR